MSWEDPIVAEVRPTRENLSARFHFDVSAIFADIRARQSAAGDRLVRASCTREGEQLDARGGGGSLAEWIAYSPPRDP
jgi:hypothetical protein